MTILAGLSPAGALIVRAGEPKVLHVALAQADGVTPQDLTGRTFALIVRRTGRVDPLFQIDGQLSMDALYVNIAMPAMQASDIYEAGAAVALSYDVVETSGGASISRFTARVNVMPAPDLPSDITPVWIELPYSEALVRPDAIVVTEKGAQGNSASRQFADAGIIDEDSVPALDTYLTDKGRIAGEEAAAPYAASAQASAATSTTNAAAAAQAQNQSALNAAAAQVATPIYMTAAAGLAAVAEGATFTARPASGDDQSFAVLYRKVSGAAVELDRYPNKQVVIDTQTDLANEIVARSARLAFRGQPIIIEDTKLLLPAVEYYSTRLLVFAPVSPPTSGASASLFWELAIPTGTTEGRLYFDYDLALAGVRPFAITSDVPFVGGERQIVLATIANGRVTPMQGVPIVGQQYRGIVANQCTFGKDMDAAPRLFATTRIGDISDTALIGGGFPRGAYDPAGTHRPYVGGDLVAPAAGHAFFGRCFVQGDSDYGFGTPEVYFLAADGSVAGTKVASLEYVLSPRAASYLWSGPLPAGAVAVEFGIEAAAGHDVRVTGVQYASGFGVQWIARADHPVVPQQQIAASKLQIVSTRFRALREFVGSPIYTRTESRLKAYTPAVPIHGLRLVYANFVVGAGTGEAPGANPITISAGVEPDYTPAFTVPVTFGGRLQTTLDPGAIMISDVVTGLSIATMADFHVRTALIVTSAGMTWPEGYYAFEPGDAAYDSNAATSQVYGTGALAVPAGGVGSAGGGYGPLAVLGYTADGQVAVAYLGDSIADGTGDTTVTLIDGYIARGLQSVDGGPIPYARLSRGSDSLYANTAPFGMRKRALFDYATHGIIALGTNDIAAGTSFASLKDLVLEISTEMRRRGLWVVMPTLWPRTTSTNGWADAAGQTLLTGFTVGGTRDQFNGWIRSGADGLIDDYYDVNEIAEDPAHPGKWNTNGTAGYPTIDGIHPTSYFHVLAGQIVARKARTFRVPRTLRIAA